MSMPAAIGDPFDDTLSIVVELALLTDGRRGWLVLACADDEYDAEVEITELVSHLLEGVPEPPRWAVRAVATSSRRRGALELSGASFEAEYERRFGDGRPSGDLEPLLASIRACGWSLRGEGAIRREMNGAVGVVGS